MNYGNTASVTELYRQIGYLLHTNGADHVYMLCAKSDETGRKVYLEIAIDGFFELKDLNQLCQNQWPDIKILLIDLNEVTDYKIQKEITEDGILL